MTKTINEWLEELSEPVRTQALKNANEVNIEDKVGSMRDAIYAAFIWKETSEGHYFWKCIANIFPIIESTSHDTDH